MIVGVVLQDLREQIVCLAEVPFGHQRLRPFELLPKSARQGFPEPVDDHLLGKGSDELVLHLAVDEELDCRDARDPVLAGDSGVLLGVELAKLPVVAVLIGQSLQDGADDTTRPAPRGPEVHQHRLFAAALDYVHIKVVGIES